MTALTIRRATLADAPAMIGLERRTANAAHWQARDYARIFDLGTPSRVALVLEEAGQLLGFIVAVEIGREWEIENIVVESEHRRRGLGSRLIRDFLDIAREQGAESVFLEVRHSNVAARALYTKWGFEEVGVRRAYYSSPVEDALIYRKGNGSTRDTTSN